MIFSVTQWQQKVDKKFGLRKVKVLDVAKGKALLRIAGQTQWVPYRTIHDRSRVETLFLSPQKAKTLAYRLVKAETSKRTVERAKARLAKWGLTDVEVSLIGNNFHFVYRGKSLKLPRARWHNDTGSAKVFISRIYAKHRFGLNTPLPYTDREWREKIEKLSSGRITSKMYIPGVTQKLVCTRCDLEFKKVRIFQRKNPQLRCPECDCKQIKGYSTSAVSWIKDLETRLGIKIRHAESRGGEASISLGKVTSVDGLYKNVVFEYHGSRWHGNPSLFLSRRKTKSLLGRNYL